MTVFISHASRDNEFFFELLVHCTGEQRLAPILTDYGFVAGDDWEREIRASIQRSDMFVVLLSREFLASKHCPRELDLIIAETERNPRKLVIPIMIDEVVEQRLAHLHRIPRQGALRDMGDRAPVYREVLRRMVARRKPSLAIFRSLGMALLLGAALYVALWRALPDVGLPASYTQGGSIDIEFSQASAFCEPRLWQRAAGHGEFVGRWLVQSPKKPNIWSTDGFSGFEDVEVFLECCSIVCFSWAGSPKRPFLVQAEDVFHVPVRTVNHRERDVSGAK